VRLPIPKDTRIPRTTVFRHPKATHSDPSCRFQNPPAAATQQTDFDDRIRHSRGGEINNYKGSARLITVNGEGVAKVAQSLVPSPGNEGVVSELWGGVLVGGRERNSIYIAIAVEVLQPQWAGYKHSI